MGKMKEHPKYNILSFRVSDEEMKLFEEFKGTQDRQSVLHKLLIGGIGHDRDDATQG